MNNLYLKDSIRKFVIKTKCLSLYYHLCRYTKMSVGIKNDLLEYCDKLSKQIPTPDWYTVKSLHIECLDEPVFKSLEYPSGTLFYIELCYSPLGEYESKNIIRFCFDYSGSYSGECFINMNQTCILWYNNHKDEIVSIFCEKRTYA